MILLVPVLVLWLLVLVLVMWLPIHESETGNQFPRVVFQF